jgi:hypothetical protein
MLEQAVIDAKELREAAMKTAEDELLKKYSSQIKEAVEALLNEEDEEAPLSEEEIEENEKVIDELEMKVLEGESNSALEEGDLVEINLDELKEELEQSLEEKKEFPDLNNDNKVTYADILIGRGVELEEEEKLDKEKPGPLDSDDIKSEEIEITEENIAEVIEDILNEKVTVDYTFVPTGNNATTHPTKAEQKYSVDAALVTSMDEEEKENIEDLKKMIETLEEQVKSINLEKNKINEDYNALKKTAVKAANKLEELNLSNAKLLYQNRVLESHSLNERQKTKLVETISKAQNITEAKVIFETSANIGQTSSKSSPQNLSEVSSKNSQLILKSNNGSNSSKQDESTSLRMKRLAGII